MKRIKINFDSYVMPRSGSTLYSNVLRKIFTKEDDTPLVCNHNFFKNMDRPVGLFRDFRDVMVSHWRIYHAKYIDGKVVNKITKKELHSMLKLILRHISILDRFIQKYPNALLVSYEEFWDNTGNLIDIISKYLDVEVPKDLREKAIEKNKIKDAKKISDSLGDDFDVVDKETELHAKHIYKATPGGWKDLVEESLHKKVNNVLGEHLERYGYKKD